MADINEKWACCVNKLDWLLNDHTRVIEHLHSLPESFQLQHQALIHTVCQLFKDCEQLGIESVQLTEAKVRLLTDFNTMLERLLTELDKSVRRQSRAKKLS